MRRSQTGLIVLAMAVPLLALQSKSLGTIQFITTILVVTVIAFADLRTNKGRAIAGEVFWLGFLAINFRHDSHSVLSLGFDLIWLLGGTAFIAWLYRRSESSRRNGTARPAPGSQDTA